MFRLRTVSVVLFIALSLLTGCNTQDRDAARKKAENLQIQDRELGYTRDDFRNAMAPRPVAAGADNTTSKVPDLAPVISDDKKNILPQPLVSITVNEDIPIRDIFYELAKQAEVDLELDPTITGSIIFTAYNRPFDQVVDRLCELSGLRYTFKNNVLRVERDTPYMKTYNVGYLSVQRDYTSTITSNTSAASGSGSSGGGGGKNGSSSTITSKSGSDFWTELQTNITQIIVDTNQQVTLTDQSTPITTPQAIPAISAQQLAAVGNTGLPDPNAPTANVNRAAAQSAQAVAQGAQPQAASPTSVTVTMGAPTAGLANPTGTQNIAGGGAVGAAGAAAGAGGAGATVLNPYFSVNKQAGLVNVFATEKQHRKIGAYITQALRAINTQVLIEAKVFEVELTDENSTGIDWSFMGNNGDINGGITLNQQNFTTNPFNTGAGAILTITNGNLNAAINAISRFGTVRTLSSPRLTVMNNQTAVLNVSESRVFFTLDLDRVEGTTTTPARVDITSTVNNVPEGVIITVHPSVDPDTQEITMNLRPSITRVVRTVRDPATALVAQSAGLDVESLVPELSIREIDSIVKMNSGATIIMGGLMQDRTNGEQVSIPVLGEIPIIGNLFRSQLDGSRKTEMVIMLRAVVMNNAKPDATDKRLYDTMSQDRRPFSF